MIEDEQLRELFRQESTEYLQRLDDGLMQLEYCPGDEAMVEALFRHAHSLKGAAHMLGMESVELLAHSLEDMLNNARRDPDSRGAVYVQEMLRQLADIRAAVADVLAAPGEPAGPTQQEELSAGRLVATPPRDSRLDVVRVESVRLDALLGGVGELSVARTRLARRLGEVEAIVEFVEHLRRELACGVDVEREATLPDRLLSLETMLGRLRGTLDEDCSRLELVGNELNEGVRSIRLLPLANIFRQFPRTVRELARSCDKQVELVIEGEDVGADKSILEEIRDPLMHLLRNAVDHGIEPATARRDAGKPPVGSIRLSARRTASTLEIVVRDDGRGLDEAAIREAALDRGLESESAVATMSSGQLRALIFRSGLTTAPRLTDVSGRGIGLDVVRAAVERMKGGLALESEPGKGIAVTMRLPVTLVSTRILIVELNGCPYGLPVEHVLGTYRVNAEDVFHLDGHAAILFEEQPIPIAPLGDLLDRPAAPPGGRGDGAVMQVVILMTVAGTFGVVVDALLDEQEVVLKPLGDLLEAVRNVAGATILDSGAVCMVLSPPELISSLRRHIAGNVEDGVGATAVARRKRVLLAEDSITTRTQECRILTAAGFDVVTAVDGLDALRRLAREEFDAVVTDVNMPNLDGLGLARRIRSEPRHAELPIVLVTSLASDEDRLRGLEAGANAYITKPAFDQRELIECLERLI